jgi:hypothetical protein
MWVLLVLSACVEDCGLQKPLVLVHLFPLESEHVVSPPVVLQVPLFWLLPVWGCDVGE